MGTILFHQRNYAVAEELYRRATVADPAYVLAYFDLGNVLDELQRLDESIAAYLQAVTLAPRYADAHYNLALAYERKGEPQARSSPLAVLYPAGQPRTLGRPCTGTDSQAHRPRKTLDRLAGGELYSASQGDGGAEAG